MVCISPRLVVIVGGHTSTRHSESRQCGPSLHSGLKEAMSSPNTYEAFACQWAITFRPKIPGTVYVFLHGLLSTPGWTTGRPSVRDAFQPLNESTAARRSTGARVLRAARESVRTSASAESISGGGLPVGRRGGMNGCDDTGRPGHLATSLQKSGFLDRSLPCPDSPLRMRSGLARVHRAGASGRKHRKTPKAGETIRCTIRVINRETRESDAYGPRPPE